MMTCMHLNKFVAACCAAFEAYSLKYFFVDFYAAFEDFFLKDYYADKPFFKILSMTKWLIFALMFTTTGVPFISVPLWIKFSIWKLKESFVEQ